MSHCKSMKIQSAPLISFDQTRLALTDIVLRGDGTSRIRLRAVLEDGGTFSPKGSNRDFIMRDSREFLSISAS